MPFCNLFMGRPSYIDAILSYTVKTTVSVVVVKTGMQTLMSKS